MAETAWNSHGGGGGGGTVVVNVDGEEESVRNHCNDNINTPQPRKKQESLLSFSVPFIQKIVAEVVGTYFLVFAGCAAVAVNAKYDKVLSLPGIAMVWGLVVMVLVYTLGHISGAHFNPAVTIAFLTCKRFPPRQVPVYIIAQVMGSTLAAGTLRLMFRLEHDVCSGKHDVFVGTLPSESNLQSIVVEFIISFFLMFVISGVATDTRSIGELAGLAVGATVTLNVLFAGPVSGASMNPARSLGPALIFQCYKKIWIYLVFPILGTISGAWIYNTVRYTDKPLGEITKSVSFIRSREGSSR